ncbi:phospholipase A [Cupriavidus basilensis]
MLQPPRVIDGTQPLALTLLISAETGTRRYQVPDTLEVTASGDLQAAVKLILRRTDPGPAVLSLHKGENRKVRYAVDLPPGLRGTIRLDAVGIDAAPVLVTLNRLATPGQPAAAPLAGPAPAGEAQSADHTPAMTVPAVPVVPVASSTQPAPAPADLRDSARLSFNDPMYFIVGAHGGANAKFQFSFKYRIFEGTDPASRRLIDNLYFAYTQFSLWDLSEDSKPFRDTNYRPSSTTTCRTPACTMPPSAACRWPPGSSMSPTGATALNRAASTLSSSSRRSISATKNDWHWRVAPKLYAYVEKSDNPDIAHYRGYMDLDVAYGRADSWEFAATLRKGTRQWYGSVDARVTYPLARLIPGTAGYLMAGYFVGYGESLLDYNHKLPWQFRLGYALSR